MQDSSNVQFSSRLTARFVKYVGAHTWCIRLSCTIGKISGCAARHSIMISEHNPVLPMEGDIMHKIPGWKKVNWQPLSRNVAILILFLTSFVSALSAQLTRGFVSGSVTDTTNAVIPGVQIVLTNNQTNISRETVTNDLGFYRFVAIEPGDYSIEFRMSGFETHKIDNVTVKTAQEVVINQTLAIAQTAIEVSVVETPVSELAKATATVDRTFTEREIVDLPIQVYNNTRDITRL